MQTTHVAEEAANIPHDSPLPGGHTPGSDEGSMTLNELTVLCTQLSTKVVSLEANLKQIKKVYGNAYTKLIMKVKKLEHKVKSSKSRRRAKITISDDEDYQEDPFKQGIDEELALRLQVQEREGYFEADKHMESHTLQQLKKLSFNEIKELFEITMKRVNTFTPMENDDTISKVVAGISKRDVEQELNQEIPEEGMNVEALQTKYLIIDWEVYTKDSKKYWKIIRVGDHIEDLVRESFSSTEPTDDKERALWVELKRLFEPDTDDLLELQRYMHDPLTWRLYDTCGVHHVSTETRLDIFMLVEKDYQLEEDF
ncbi:hypothetical protein Tco_0322467 [Tanacetum coccineum]